VKKMKNVEAHCHSVLSTNTFEPEETISI